VRYKVYSIRYQHSSILRESHFRVENKSANFSANYSKDTSGREATSRIITLGFVRFRFGQYIRGVRSEMQLLALLFVLTLRLKYFI
jgi:hypothetical protein